MTRVHHGVKMSDWKVARRRRPNPDDVARRQALRARAEKISHREANHRDARKRLRRRLRAEGLDEATVVSRSVALGMWQRLRRVGPDAMTDWLARRHPGWSLATIGLVIDGLFDMCPACQQGGTHRDGCSYDDLPTRFADDNWEDPDGP